MIPTSFPRKLPGRAVSLALLALGLSGNATAGKWIVTPKITAQETYTDNAALATLPTGGEFVTDVAPGIRVAGAGSRVRGHLDYTAHALLYGRNSSQDRIVSTMNALGTLEAVKNFFYVDAYGNISQTFISPFAAQPSNVTNFTNNRVEARTFGMSPYARGRVKDLFSYEVRYRYTNSSWNNSALSDLYTTDWSGRVASPVRLFGWALDYDDNTVTYNNYTAGRQYSKLSRGTLYYQPDARLLLHVGGGHEVNNYSFERHWNNIYGAGASWKPTPITSADFNWEHRFFGPYRYASLKHRTRLTAWTFTYSRDVTNNQRALLTLLPGNTAALLDAIFSATIPDPSARQAAIEQFLRTTSIPAFLANPVSFYTQQVFLQERADASVAILGKKSSLLFSVFHDKSRALTGNFSTAAPDAFILAQGSAITQNGFGASVNRSLTGSTSLGASATRTYAREEVPTTVDSRNDRLTLSFNRTLSPKTNVFGGFDYSHFKSTYLSTAGSSNARSIFVGLSHRF